MSVRTSSSKNHFFQELKKLIRTIKGSNHRMRSDQQQIEHVDLETGVIHGVLKQVRNKRHSMIEVNNPPLVSVWCCEIKPTQSKLIITTIREAITPYDPVVLTQVKRFKKIQKMEGTNKITTIQVILGSDVLFKTQNHVTNLLKENCPDLDPDNLNIHKLFIPEFPANTKDMSDKWSTKFWPMSWKGNPNHQVLKSTNFNLMKERSMIGTLLKKLREKDRDKSQIYNVTIIARENKDSENHEILCIKFDERHSSPLNHSIMSAIGVVAEREKSSKEKFTLDEKKNYGYLCQDLLVYTIMEPCTMCCMALVHSRIKNIIYLKDSLVGGLSTHYQLGDMDSLNWKFGIWKWIGENELKELEEIMYENAKEARTASIETLEY